MYNINMKTPSLSKNQHSVTHCYMLTEKCKVAKLPLIKLWATVVKSALIKSKCIFSPTHYVFALNKIKFYNDEQQQQQVSNASTITVLIYNDALGS